MTTPIPPEQWRVVLATAGRTVITDPDDVASMLTDEQAAGTISIRRRSAVPNEHGRLPNNTTGVLYQNCLDLTERLAQQGKALPPAWSCGAPPTAVVPVK